MCPLPGCASHGTSAESIRARMPQSSVESAWSLHCSMHTLMMLWMLLFCPFLAQFVSAMLMAHICKEVTLVHFGLNNINGQAEASKLMAAGKSYNLKQWYYTPNKVRGE